MMPYLVAIWTVWAQAVVSSWPMPADDGQMSALTSLSCHVWCDVPSCEPAFSTDWTHDAALSRQYIQPRNEASRNFSAILALLPVLSHFCEAKIMSWSMAVPSVLKLMTLRSDGWYSLPVTGLVASRTCAYSL